MAKILIKNGKLFDPASKTEKLADLLINNGWIEKIGKNLKASSVKLIDAKGCWVMPGLVDMHVHLRDPGNPEEETIASGTAAAAAGGITSVACMANTDPVIDNPEMVRYVVTRAKSEARVRVFPIGAVTRGLEGRQLTEMGTMLKEGAIAFSDDGQWIADASVMRHALEYLKPFNLPLISHAEDYALSQKGQMNESLLSTKMGLKGIPKLAEETAVSRDIALAQEFGWVHIAHVSCAGSVKLIRAAKKKGIKITAETAPHYFILTQDAVANYNTMAKVNPPLREKEDIAEIIKGLKDGTIDVIATDHAPHLMDEKNIEFELAATGLVGLETLLALVNTYLIEKQGFPVLLALSKMTNNPAKILNLPFGVLQEGAAADVVVFDPKKEWEIDPAKFKTRSRNTPFAGMPVKGKVLHTIVNGQLV